jgi:regulator of sirC expression with transglutaminase-like and TPR domain
VGAGGSRRRFAELLASPGGAIPLAEAALLIACEEYPSLDVGAYLARLDSLGSAAREAVGASGPIEERIAAFSGFLCDREGFAPNADDYYDPRNSFLNDVLDRRVGIPITLATVFMEVGRRAGIELLGVGFPGHFLVKAAVPEGELILDPWSGGRQLSQADCQRRLDRVYGGRVRLEPDMLEAVPARLMLLRMLRNLKAIYTRTQDPLRLLRVLDLLLLLIPDAPEERRDRGLVYAELDCYAPAAEDLETYLSLAPAAADAASLAARIVDLRQRAARLN